MIKTKFGTAHLNKDGYYEITSTKEGNFHKQLHRLVFEDFYNITLPSSVIIHHEDENKLNNEIWNLVPMSISEHASLHNKGRDRSGVNGGMWGKTHSSATKQKMREHKIGSNNVNALYDNLWDISCTTYNKTIANKNPKILHKCFGYKYHGRYIPIGVSFDFITPKIIDNLVKEALS